MSAGLQSKSNLACSNTLELAAAISMWIQENRLMDLYFTDSIHSGTQYGFKKHTLVSPEFSASFLNLGAGMKIFRSMDHGSSQQFAANTIKDL